MTEIYDSNGTLITVGARIVTGDGFEIGTVTALTEPDGDVNSYGRAVPIGPYVFVQYDDDGQTERWPATWNATGLWDDYRDDYTCDDVTVAMAHAFKVGDDVLATTTATDIPVALRDAKATVTRIIGDDERDAEVGPMYEVTVTVQVFEDELRKTRGEGVDVAAVEALERYARGER